MRIPLLVSFTRLRKLSEPECRWMFASTQPHSEYGGAHLDWERKIDRSGTTAIHSLSSDGKL
jgi:hypothetical protein